MRVLWDGDWLEAPLPPGSPSGVMVEVEATIPLIHVPHPVARVYEARLRRLAVFAALEGPRSAYRKGRGKLWEQSITKDFRVVVLLGRELEKGGRIAGLACRVPPCASVVQTHRDLVMPVTAEFDKRSLAGLAEALLEQRELLERNSGDPFLFSQRAPPVALTDQLRAAFDRSGFPKGSFDLEVIRPPKLAERGDTAILVKRSDASGMPTALLGAGDYARTVIAPALRRAPVRLEVLADREPHTAALVARELDFARATTDAEQAIDSLPEAGLVVVATNHDSHAALAARALRAGHRVLLEKPAVVTPEDLELLLAARQVNPGLELGFNRRYHPLVRSAQAALENEAGPITFIAVVKEVPIVPEFWYLWPNQGTRITGNLCHWIDLGVSFAPNRATLETLSVSPSEATEPEQERGFFLRFDDGSLVTIVATGRGDATRGVQEWIEVRRGETTVTLDDLRRLRILRGGRVRSRRTLWRDKGHGRMYAEALDRLLNGRAPLYPARDLVSTSVAQIAMTRLALNGGGEESVGGLVRRLDAGTGAGG